MKSDSSMENPYRPPETNELVPAASVPLEFAGEITLADYIRMLPTTMDIIWGRVLLSLAVLVSLPVLAAAALVIFKKLPGTMFAVLLASTLISLAIAGAIYLVSPSARARRYLRGNADLLGLVQGRLGTSGLFLEKGTYKHWLSWAALHAVASRTDGLRVSLNSSPGHFLALSSRIFSPYSRKHAERIVAEQRHRKRTTDELLVDSCDVFDKSVTDSGFFCGVISIPQSFRSVELWTSIIGELTTGIVMTLFALFSFGYWRLVGIFGIYCIVVAAQRYWLYLYGSQVTSHFAWGWVDSGGLIYAVDSQATWRPRVMFNKIVAHERYIEFYLVSGDRLFVYIEHMKNPPEFINVANAWKCG